MELTSNHCGSEGSPPPPYSRPTRIPGKAAASEAEGVERRVGIESVGEPLEALQSAGEKNITFRADGSRSFQCIFANIERFYCNERVHNSFYGERDWMI